ncbi:MAG: hypothetical protein IT483_06835 [Gammaproteobacteria bacterium]|nr:hypothetical protein [Gammaproteobacteria bacterium]
MLEIVSGVLAFAGIVGVLAPIVYLLYGCVFWLQHGTWIDWNLCTTLAPAPGCRLDTEWVGLNQVVKWLLEHPFAASCALGLACWMICLTISDSLVKLATKIRGKPAGGDFQGEGDQPPA